jgi:iron complex transport system substrate-binding protein
MIRIRDALGVELALERPARRVVSLVPSITETLFDLGAGAILRGCTRFCIHPKDGVAGVPKVGGTKDPDLAGILALAPDLVLANREENRESDVAELRKSVPVHVSYPRDLPGLLAFLEELGALVGLAEAARAAISRIESAQRAFIPPARPPRVAYLLWREPWMAAGADTFIDGMLAACGFQNALGHEARYPVTELQALRGAVDALLLSSEPFPFGERHRPECAAATGLDLSRVQLVSGEAFSWFGTRTASAFAEAARVHQLLSGG